MSQKLPSITDELKDFIAEQKIFFVGTAASEGRVNISPKGTDSLRVTGSNEVIWLNLTGSGNETAAHLLLNDRMTIMFCSFEDKPLILRLYGCAKAFHKGDDLFEKHIGMFPANAGARQIILLKIDLVQTSCGYAVPFMEYKEDRVVLNNWANNKGEDFIESYWEEKNVTSIDGFDTGILKNKSNDS